MAKAEIGTSKYQAKKLKAAGLQRLRFYCQLCQKQCRDENGFKNHINSPSHQRKVENVQSQGSSVVEEYSREFLKDFLKILKMNHGTKKIDANKFYQEYILHDRNHIHMNATKWSSLTQFVKYLGREGLVRVEDDGLDDDSGFNLSIRLIDRSTFDIQKEQSNNDTVKGKKLDEYLSEKVLQQQMQKSRENLEQYGGEKEKTVQETTKPTEPIKITLKRKVQTERKNIMGFDDSSSDEDS